MAKYLSIACQPTSHRVGIKEEENRLHKARLHKSLVSPPVWRTIRFYGELWNENLFCKFGNRRENAGSETFMQ